MKHNNEILTIFEDEFVRVINRYDLSMSDSNNKRILTATYAQFIELYRLCRKMEIPFEYQTDDCKGITSITLSGKRIEFKTGEENGKL